MIKITAYLDEQAHQLPGLQVQACASGTGCPSTAWLHLACVSWLAAEEAALAAQSL